MTEEKKFRFLKRAVTKELFACLVHNPAKTVAEFASEGAAIENMLKVLSRQYDRPVNALVSEASGAGAIGSHKPREAICAVARKEMCKLFRKAHNLKFLR